MIFLLDKWMTNRPSEKGKLPIKGESKQQYDKEGNLFIDQDPKDFVYILKGLRDFQPFSFSASKPIFVPKEAFSGIRIIDHRLGLNMLDQFKCLD